MGSNNSSELFSFQNCSENSQAGTQSNTIMEIQEYNGVDHLSNLNPELLENVLAFLEVKDLVALSETCKILYQSVQNYTFHYIHSYSRLERLTDFLNCGILNLDEKPARPQFFQTIKNGKVISPNMSLFIYHLVKKYTRNFFKRYSVTENVSFPHYSSDGNSHYVSIFSWLQVLKILQNLIFF